MVSVIETNICNARVNASVESSTLWPTCMTWHWDGKFLEATVWKIGFWAPAFVFGVWRVNFNFVHGRWTRTNPIKKAD